MKENNTPKKASLSDRELNAVSGGWLNEELQCKYCRKWYGNLQVQTKVVEQSCASNKILWLCPNCNKWN